ncbi:MAG: alpha/beta hydrolase-fold protein [Flavobacteriales bacterium]|nr:alpha/beta hydrolase-fold protein [Flavobacteriales bacterium]
MRIRFCFLLLFLGFSSFGQLTIRIDNAFHLTPLTDTLYLSGDFNNWLENDTNYVFQRIGFNQFELTFLPNAGNMSFKLTRGSWNKPEADGNGNYLNNRSYTYNGGLDTLIISIDGWEDIGGINSTSAESNTHIWYDQMFIPQLNRYRRVWVYLPPDYHTTTKSYSSLYLQDGQSLFDLEFASFGEWEVDESLNDQFFNNGDPGCIAIGIDHGGVDRINEYSPWVNPSYGGGEGGLYMDFIVQNLVPLVDSTFRTIQNVDHRGIMGSSMGGLITQYGATEFQNIFGKAGVMSPAFWFSNNIFSQVSSNGIQGHMKYWLMGGVNESSTLVQELQNMESTLISNGLPANRVNLTIHSDGQHSEWYWAREFPYAYYWLFYDEHFANPVGIESRKYPGKLEVYPNPVQTILTIQSAKKVAYRILDFSGRLVRNGSEKDINVSNLENGVYILQVEEEGNLNQTSFIKSD